MERFFEQVRSSVKIKAPLDSGFIPASLFVKIFEERAKAEGSAPVAISIEDARGRITRFETVCFADEVTYGEQNKFYIERIVKSLIWIYGGCSIIVGAPLYIGQSIKEQYAAGGLREFDFNFFNTVYERALTITAAAYDDVPASKPLTKPVGRHLDGCRLGFDAGGSDIKVSAVIDGQTVFSKEVVWHPKTQTNPKYHFKHIVEAMKLGASQMPRVDAVGISSAGVYIDNRTMIASLFIKVAPEDFDAHVKDIYIRAVKELGEDIPMEVSNDGDVTALAGAMDIMDNNVLGIAMGTSQASGFVDSCGNITGWINELAFVPCDFNPKAAPDEWSGDVGCGVKYFSQDAVARLAPAVGIDFTQDMTPAEKLKHVQNIMDTASKSDKAGKGTVNSQSGNLEVVKIYQTIGVYLGYAIAYYARFYDIKHILVLGRVTSGKGGQIILDCADKVLKEEFGNLNIKLHLPDESSRRVGQSIAAASLPEITKRGHI